MIFEGNRGFAQIRERFEAKCRPFYRTDGDTMIAWHYTTGTKIDLINESGVLMPADIGVAPPELPIIWFSTHGYYDNSARKGVQGEDGGIRAASVEEMYEMTGGLYRFGCPVSRLKHGENLRKAAKMKSLVWRKLVRGANAMGANSLDWWGLAGDSMPIDGLRFESMDSDLKWRAA